MRQLIFRSGITRSSGSRANPAYLTLVQSVRNPPLDHLFATMGSEMVWAEVLIRRATFGFELRHVADRERPLRQLRSLPVSALRELGQFTAEGAFRPLKSAPTLRHGWRCPIGRGEELDEALRNLYPGALPDWWCVENGRAEPAQFRAVAARQSG